MEIKHLLVILCCGCLLFNTWASGKTISVEARDCTVTAEANGTFILKDVGNVSHTGRFFVVNGKTQQRETLSACEPTAPDKLVVQTPSGCRLEISLSARNRMVLAETDIINNSEQEIWVEIGV